MQTALDIVRKQEQDYINSDTQISEYVSFSLKENVDKIEAYLNSKHISGERDSLGREKPFFNIVTAASNVWYRATDIDRANIRIKSTRSSNHTVAMLANAKSKEWMRKSNFGVWLNDWGLTLARYGSAVSKFVEQDGKLVATVVPWNRLIVDSIDFYNNPIIEKHYYTAGQLRKNKLFDQEQVEALIAHSKQSRETLGGDKSDTKAEYIEVYELHGELPKSLLTGKESDEDETVQQVHICSFNTNEEGDYLDYTLYKGREKNPYHITHLIKQDGRVMSIGAVEHLFEAQWMVNHNEKAIKDHLELASKMVFQTSDPAYQGKNTGDLDNGTILYHEPNQPLTQLANTSHDVSALQSHKIDWQNLAAEVSSTPDAIRGVTPPSGTALGTVQITAQQGLSLFELMVENKGLALEEIWREFVIPNIKKQLDTKEEIVATLDNLSIKQIDSLYIPNEAKRRFNQMAVEKVIQALETDDMSMVPSPYDPRQAEMDVANDMKSLGNNRYFAPDELSEKTWKEVFKDFEWDIEIEVTNEQSDKQAVLANLNDTLGKLAQLGDIENARLVLAKILEETDIFSPMEIATASAAPQVAPQGSTSMPNSEPVAQAEPSAPQLQT
jgi:hypothetical protein